MSSVRYSRKSASISLLLLLASCSIEPKPCYTANQADYTEFAYTPNRISPNGIDVDDPKAELDLNKLDTITNKVATCLQQFKDKPLTEDEKKLAECTGTFDPVIKPCFGVKVPDWHLSCSGEQVFKCDVPEASCTVKGFKSDPKCPCSCRAIVQWDQLIVTTPNMKIYAGQLSTLLTGCTNTWTGRLLECAKIEE